MRLGRTTPAVVVVVTLACIAGSRTHRVEAKDRTAPFTAQAHSPVPPTIQVYSRETIVDVSATGKDGKPVHGLTRADFLVLEDGREQSIRSFEESGAGGTATQPTPEEVEKLPPHVYTNRQAALATGPVNIILLDSVNMDMGSQMRAKVEIARYLRTMPAGTRVALLRLGSALQLVQGFTSDSQVLITALNDMKNTVMPPGMTEPCLRAMAPRLTALGLRQIGALLEGVKGRKSVLWFTGNVTYTPVASGGSCGEAAKQIELQRALELLAASRVAVYSFDTRGVFNPNPLLSPDDKPGLLHPVTSYGGAWLEINVIGPTGGQIFRGNNDFVGEMRKAVELGSNYYSISYVPAHGNDGNYHRVTVRVDRPGLELTYRPGYGADDVVQIAADTHVPTTLNVATPEPEQNTMVASMARFAPPATQMLFDVKVAPTTAKPQPTDAPVIGFPVAAVKDKPMVRYDILYSLPADQIAFTETDGLYSGKLEFDVVASDVFGKLITTVSRTIPLTLSAGDYGGFVETPFRFFQQIDLPAGQTYVRVGVLDKVSNKIGTVEIPVMTHKVSNTAKK